MAEKKKVEIIQLLRLIGAICIIIYHSGIVGEHGYFAVEIFCILSGYILMYSTQKESSKQGFLKKRILRIVPLYWISTIFMYLLLLVAPQLSIMAEAKPEYLLKSMFFIPFFNSKGYGVPILGIGWTLNYEMFFYLIFFIALHISHKLRGIISSAIIIVLVALHYILDFDYLIWNYYTDAFMLEFVFGIIAFYAMDWLKTRVQKPGIKYCLLALSACSFVWMCLDVGVGTNILRCVRLGIPALLFFMIIIACYEQSTYPKLLISYGNATFSIYLLEYFSTAAYKLVASYTPIYLDIILFILMLLATLILGYWTYKYIESPLYNKLQNIRIRGIIN